MKIIIIDNYDSFTYNLYQLVGDVAYNSNKQVSVEVYRNDKITPKEIKALKPDRIIISPGGGNVYDKKYFGICDEIITALGKDIPLLGVCLGMQGIAKNFGGEIIKLNTPMHGKISNIQHNLKGIYKDIVQNIEVMRYHSLAVSNKLLLDNNELEVTSMSVKDANESIVLDFSDDRYKNEVIMGIEHKTYPICGVQFHLESFGSEGGAKMMENFLYKAY